MARGIYYGLSIETAGNFCLSFFRFTDHATLIDDFIVLALTVGSPTNTFEFLC